MSKIYVYLKGKFVTEDKAVISVRDRGFRFGDGLFETIRVVNGNSWQWDLHMKRLQMGLDLLKIRADISDFRKIAEQLLEKNKVSNGFLRIAISRGEGSRGYLPDIKGGATVVIETVPPIDDINDPVDLWVSSLKHIAVKAKTMQGLNSTLARMEAVENDCFEAVLCDNDGNICEASSSNIFWVKGNKVFTPSLSAGIVPGTVRDAVICLSPLAVEEGIYDFEEIQNADEIFLTNVAWLLVPVKRIKPLGLEFKRFDMALKIKELVLQDAVTEKN